MLIHMYIVDANPDVYKKLKEISHKGDNPKHAWILGIRPWLRKWCVKFASSGKIYLVVKCCKSIAYVKHPK